MFDSRLPISYYKKIACLNSEHGIDIVQHIETGKIFLQKELAVYSLDVYASLFRFPVRNIPRIYALYEDAGRLTVIEEYVSGDTLQEILDICGPFSEEEVVEYSILLCDILTTLHSMKPSIIHRDIKPSNVILTEDGRIVLIDLNAARQTDHDKERDTKLLGTKGFAAPEQFGFGSSTPQTDIYALGILMKTLLGEADPGKKLARIIDRCLEMNPKDRFISAHALQAQLKKLR